MKWHGKLISVFSLCVYIVFSQFVVKAWITTDLDTMTSNESSCMNKQLDTYESKYQCRKSKTDAITDISIQLNTSEIVDTVFGYEQITIYIFDAPAISRVVSYARPPPGDPHKLFLQGYIGISRNIIYG